jgi:hypothetical protein
VLVSQSKIFSDGVVSELIVEIMLLQFDFAIVGLINLTSLIIA